LTKYTNELNNGGETVRKLDLSVGKYKEIHGTKIYPLYYIYDEENNEKIADLIDYKDIAQLFAAAPELLEACKEALEFMEDIANYGRLEKLRQAIAKAEGRKEA
jgi:hypothetical protein